MRRTDPRADLVARVLKAFPQATKVLLFGSRAWGAPSPESDYDLLIVTETSLRPPERAARVAARLWGFDAPVDAVVVTPSELERLRTWRSSVVYRALRDGEVLHEAA